ncbi:hypothetical protein [Pantoea sp. GL120224-02]|uniref:hypothetical protein n=1 Tax=Pantoea sp. GL120224-02 TaxID=1378084 RepID=UPI000BD0A585|nr:hypothetical protein [Pantoea sp. GL120224-02]SNY71499.1 hypothetical protein SAMN02744778_03179 [Pantoea sp. GL120224-02]
MIRIFLTSAVNHDKQLNDLIQKLELQDFREVYRRLKEKPAFGYPFAPNCTKQYALYCEDNPWYASLCHVTPQSAIKKHNLESARK